ncbi:MAG: 6-phosphogluconolactonase [Rhodothermales bacterium]
MKAEIRVCSDLGHLSRQAAGRVVQWINEVVACNGRCALALAGGSTPRTLYKLLAKEYAERIPWPTPFKVFNGCDRYTEARYSAGNGYLLQIAHLSVIERP